MNLVSILITIAGIIAILALYIISKLSQQKQPKDQIIVIPKYYDDEGRILSSVLNDIPAADGSTPPPPPIKTEDDELVDSDNEVTQERQVVLFIAAKDGNELSGDDIPQVLEKHKLSFGEMDIFHYQVEDEDGDQVSLFRIANGIKPWTLVPDELQGTTTPGLSLIMQLPSEISNLKAMELFVDSAQNIASDLDAQLKNSNQEDFSDEDKVALLESID